MAARWSSENVVAEHRELQANAMALDRRGEYALLAGRRALALIRLDSPSEVVKKVSRTQQKYDVTAAEWNPTQSQENTFVLAFGERAEICQWSDGSMNGTSSLRAHTRTITDLNWHRMDPNLLATCSIDTFVHIWDTRESRKPVASLSSIAGASQVKWNKLNHNLLASGHDCDIRVWDNRKPTQPTQFISAHLSKIQGLDWSPNHESHLVTSSNDCTVKFFDIMNPRKAENFINTLSPVWRARYTPFGEGVVTVVAPQLRRGENPLLLWAVRDVSAPVHTFVGHSDMVLEFEWRLSGGEGEAGPGEHQLVTWARDHSLRIWRVDQHLQRLCGEEAGLGESTDSELTSESATIVECVIEGEAGRDSSLLREEQDTHSLSGGNDDDAGSSSPRYEGAAQPIEASENAVHRISVESSSTTEASEVPAAPTTVERTAGENVSAASSVAGTPSSSGLAIAKPLSGQASTLPVGQPMSLHQEFSLLNTSLDSSQVNSVEVVATGREGLPGVGEQVVEEVITIKEEVIDEEVILEDESCCTILEDMPEGFTSDKKKSSMAIREEGVTSEDAVYVEEMVIAEQGDALEVTIQKESIKPRKDNADKPTKHIEVSFGKGNTTKKDKSHVKGVYLQDCVEEGSIVQDSKCSTVEKAIAKEGNSLNEAITQPEVTAGREGIMDKVATQKKASTVLDKISMIGASALEERHDVNERDTEKRHNIKKGDSAQKRDAVQKGDTKVKRQTVKEREVKQKSDSVEKRDTEQEGEAVEEREMEEGLHNIMEGETEQGRHIKKESDFMENIDMHKTEQERQSIEVEGLEQRRHAEGEPEYKIETMGERNSEQERHILQEEDSIEEGSAVEKQSWQNDHVDPAQQGVNKNMETTSDLNDASCIGVQRTATVDGSVGKVHNPTAKRKSSTAAASGVGNGNGDEGGGRKDRKRTTKVDPPSNRREYQVSAVQDHSGSKYDEPESQCVIKIQCVGEDKDTENIAVVEASGDAPTSWHKISLWSPQDKSKETPKASVWDTPNVSLAAEEVVDFERDEAVIHVECDTELDLVDDEDKGKDENVCKVVTSGSFVIKGAASSLMQVEASVVHLPESLTCGSQTPEEVLGSLAPQLLEGGIIVPGENLVLGVLSLVTMVEVVEVDGEAQTQITISPLAEPVEAYHRRGVNFILVTKNSDVVRGLGGDSEGKSREKMQVQNAPRSDAPGPFRCDKCDKTYSVRSSLNSHRVTHNAKKLYKCDECDRAFHYSTPLLIHKRTHSDERPYCCQICSAAFKSMTNLRYHQRQHSRDRPILCPDCNRGFRDHTSLKRHRQRMHQTVASDSSNSAPPPSSPQKGAKSEQTKDGQNTNSKSHGDQEPTESSPAGLGTVGRLSDYIHRCGLCHMTCHTRPQMLTHLQVHAAAERFRCRYCTKAYTFRFLLARHVRELHPGRPQWFCQHCDRIFDTCRKMNSHSCRSVRGNYSCPHHCGFTTEVRHRVFRHVARHHPEDAAPYHCDFCSNSYRDPGRLRYHQKRQHPEKMPELAPPPKDTWRAESAAGPEDKGAVDMSQVEVSVMGDAIEYFLPEDLRNDTAFRERVKFKCFYCEAKFPVKNAMTRHVLRAHPGKRAYKCLCCNVFFRSNTESKNHNRKYHKYQDTGGRDPHRNEKAMRKRAQAVEEELRHAAPGLRSAYRFRCLYCPMAYRCKRPLVTHYRRWHPDQEWDHLPDRPSSSVPSSSKRRQLLFFDCKFDSECGRTFDELELLLEHLHHAHQVSGDDALNHVKERVVVEGVRRGRLPKNAVLLCDEPSTIGSPQRKRMWWKGRKRVKSEDETEETEEEDEFDDEEFDDMSDDDYSDEDMEEEVLKIKIEDSPSPSETPVDDETIPLIPETRIKLEKIDSVGDVKKMLYRCRRCGVSCSSKVQYRQHTAAHLNSEKEQENQTPKHSSSPEKVPVLGSRKKKAKQLDKGETDTPDEGILITSLKEEVNEEEEEVTVLTLTSSASGLPMVKVEASALKGAKETDSKKKMTTVVSHLSTPPSSPLLSSSSSPTSPQATFRASALRSPSRSASKTKEERQFIRSKGRPPGKQHKPVSTLPGPALQKVGVQKQARVKQQRSIKPSRVIMSKKLQCPDCSMSFKTRSEVSFHRRLDH